MYETFKFFELMAKVISRSCEHMKFHDRTTEKE